MSSALQLLVEAAARGDAAATGRLLGAPAWGGAAAARAALAAAAEADRAECVEVLLDRGAARQGAAPPFSCVLLSSMRHSL